MLNGDFRNYRTIMMMIEVKWKNSRKRIFKLNYYHNLRDYMKKNKRDKCLRWNVQYINKKDNKKCNCKLVN